MFRFKHTDLSLSTRENRVSIHPMFRFKLTIKLFLLIRLHSFNTSYVSVQVLRKVETNHNHASFNTSYVSVQVLTGRLLYLLPIVSIHPMFRFKNLWGDLVTHISVQVSIHPMFRFKFFFLG